ncbi:MAG: GAF domain-containing protein, partial [Omnitrophica WOR_2 bacterium]
WLSNNTENLKELSMLPGIQSMDLKSQSSILRTIASAHPMLAYVKTVDWMGNTVASTDSDHLQNVRDQQWFQALKNGAKIAHQTTMVESSGQSLLVEAAPILDEFNQPVGAAIIASKIPMISNELVNSWAGKQISAYLIDPDNHVLAHSDPNYPVNLRDMSSDPAVSMLRTGINGSIYFVDAQGKSWLGDVERFDNGWGLVVQQPESDVLTPLLSYQKVAWIVPIAGLSIILLLSWLTVRQAVQPVQDLILAATSASRGDLTTQAPVKSDDELGQLARIFNSMIAQLHETITGLETRLSRRNQELERQAAEMQTAADIAREAASIHDLKTLLDQSTRLISERFGFYHVGVFLIDEANEYAVLQSANSEGGQRMLARGYKLKVGQAGIVGYVADRGVSHIALDTGVDAMFFNNPDLPATRSEIALPLNIRNHTVGVLDVQSTEAEAFSQQDAGILQILADQIALAIENTRLIEESQKALHEVETLYVKETKEAWKQEIEGKTLAFHYNRLDLAGTLTGNDGNDHSGSEYSNQADERNLLVPINLGGIELGSVHLSRGSDEQPWSPAERAFVEEAISQVAQGLENARLVQEIQKHARQEEMLSRLSASFTRTLGLDALLKTAVNEISHLPGVAEVAIHIGMPDHSIVEEIRESNAS